MGMGFGSIRGQTAWRPPGVTAVTLREALLYQLLMEHLGNAIGGDKWGGYGGGTGTFVPSQNSQIVRNKPTVGGSDGSPWNHGWRRLPLPLRRVSVP
jgi:hypothetical protein